LLALSRRDRHADNDWALPVGLGPCRHCVSHCLRIWRTMRTCQAYLQRRIMDRSIYSSIDLSMRKNGADQYFVNEQRETARAIMVLAPEIWRQTDARQGRPSWVAINPRRMLARWRRPIPRGIGLVSGWEEKAAFWRALTALGEGGVTISFLRTGRRNGASRRTNDGGEVS
jgi:hypothetical protein